MLSSGTLASADVYILDFLKLAGIRPQENLSLMGGSL